MNEEELYYLLDSNIVSEIIKAYPDFNVISKIAEHGSECAICSAVWEELLFGVKILPETMNKTYLEKFIREDVHANFKVLSYTEKAAEIHAELRAALSKIGKPTQKSDSLIASIAVANNMVLVTRNIKHFEAIQQVSSLKVENWFEK